MKIESYVENVKKAVKLHSKYPSSYYDASFLNGYLTGVRDMAADDDEISIYDFDDLIDYIGLIRQELEKELDNK